MTLYTVEQESRTARDCFRVASTSLELAKRALEDWEKDHHVATGIAFSAFAIEAMLNHYGQIFFQGWNDTKGNRANTHKKLFRAVNLNNYLGSKTYQLAKDCFELRDKLVHGKTTNKTLSIEFPDELNSRDVVPSIIGIKSDPFQNLNLECLSKFIDIAKKIQKDIEDNGFYPQPEGASKKQQVQLCETPFDTSGLRMW